MSYLPNAKIDLQSQLHIENTLSLFPDAYHDDLLSEYQRTFDSYTLTSQGLRAANLYFLGLQNTYRDKSLAADNDLLTTKAERYANYCIRQNAEKATFFAELIGINPPQANTEKGVYLRLSDPKWWTRKLLMKAKRARELFAIQSGKVHKLASPYCSQHAFDAIRKQDERNQALMKQVKLVSGEEEISLYDAWQSSNANPYNRFVELVTRIKGFESYAQDKGHAAQFLTITAPSKYHAYLSSGHRNPKYQGASPRDTHHYFMALWVKLRALFAKHDIDIYGLRIVEPHHDATPHQHMILFGNDSNLQAATQLMQDYYTQEDKHELQDESVRFKAIEIDSTKGSAVGYVVKYLAKNILSEQVNLKVGEDYDTGKPVTETSGKVVAWARTWGIRQFTFFGGASVTPWRELRRIKEPLNDHLLEQVRQAAHESDYGQYMRLVDDIQIKPYAIEAFNTDTGELSLNQYQEPVRKIKGLQHDSEVIITRFKEWIVLFDNSTAETESADAWTCINKCNQAETEAKKCHV